MDGPDPGIVPRTVREAATSVAAFTYLLHRVDNLSSRIVWRAAAHLPEALSQRLAEEWAADLSSRCRRISRLGFALGCCWAALAIKRGDWYLTATSGSPTREQIMANRAHHGPGLRYARTTCAAPGGVMCEINTTPLIDVMLVLLVTMIISLPLMTHAVKLDFAHGQSPHTKSPPEVVTLDIDFDGTLAWNGMAIPNLQQLERLLRAAAQRDPQPEIHVHPDRAVKYASVAKVLAAAQHNRMTKIGFVGMAEFKD
jgi:biopolymer transport protein ExbD